MTDITSSQISRRYSKSSSFYFETKRDFFQENVKLLERAQRKNKLYIEQPHRTKCKICHTDLANESDLQQHGVGYTLCTHCDHLNGQFEDTESFARNIYVTENDKSIASSYIDANFEQRANDIYTPKVDYLLEHVDMKGRELLDVGCGGGFFVYACLNRGIETRGIDVSSAMVDFGNANISDRINKAPLTVLDEHGFFEQVRSTDATIISTIGVIEHLREPHRLFAAFRESNARFLYYSVPMFSASVLIENAFEDIYPRQLSGGHTHLFTESSIEELNRQVGARPIAEWRFGADIMDLYRSLMARAQKNGASSKMTDKFGSNLAPQIDALQNILDQAHFCSEIHAIVEKV